MKLFNFFRPAAPIIKDEPPTYKQSEAAVFTHRFIQSIKSIRNAAVIKSDHTMALYINTAHLSAKMLKNIEKGDDEKALKYLDQVRFYSNNLFANTNISVLHKEIYTSREIFRNIEAILYDG